MRFIYIFIVIINCTVASAIPNIDPTFKFRSLIFRNLKKFSAPKGCEVLLSSTTYKINGDLPLNLAELIIPLEISKGTKIEHALQIYFDKLREYLPKNSSRGRFSADDVLKVAFSIRSSLAYLENYLGSDIPVVTIFGSFINGLAGPESDLDLMADLSALTQKQRALFENNLLPAIYGAFRKRSLIPLKRTGFEPVSLEHRSDYAIDGRPLLLEISTTTISLILIPRTHLKQNEASSLGVNRNSMRDALIFQIK